MSSSYDRILLHITMVSGSDPTAAKMAEATYLRINNILSGISRLPNIASFFTCCADIDKKLGAYIRNECFDVKKENTFFNPDAQKPNSMLNVIDNSERGKIRVLLCPGNKREYISGLKMKETTHNMIIQFGSNKSDFIPTEPHDNPPSFYQVCNSVEVALLYFEALLFDACMCHYMGVSDAAPHHDDKQKISSEKVRFLKEICASGKVDSLTPGARKLVKHVVSCFTETTPYVSFFSIFTIASRDGVISKDVDGKEVDVVEAYFDDYLQLWAEFQKWYYTKHGRMFSKNKEILNPLDTILDRNVYQGQISPSAVIEKIKKILEHPKNPALGSQLGTKNRYTFVIVRHIPSDRSELATLDSLFPGQMHQAKWDVVHWTDLEKYKKIPDLELVPFMIDI